MLLKIFIIPIPKFGELKVWIRVFPILKNIIIPISEQISIRQINTCKYEVCIDGVSIYLHTYNSEYPDVLHNLRCTSKYISDEKIKYTSLYFFRIDEWYSLKIIEFSLVIKSPLSNFRDIMSTRNSKTLENIYFQGIISQFFTIFH